MTFDREALQAKYICEKATTHNSSYPKGGVSYSKDSLVVNQTLVFQIKFCGKIPALRVAAKRQAVKKLTFKKISDFFVVYISNRLRYFRF